MTEKISEINRKINAIVPYILENNDRLKIYKELIDSAKAQRDEWNEIYPIYT